MSDQGDKIIHLAREVLRSGRLAEAYDGKQALQAESKMLSIKAAALAALLSAFGSATLTHLIEENRRPVSRYERVEIDALIFYAARQKAITEDSLRQDLKSNLSLTSMNDLSVFDYRRIRDYLWERIQG